MVKIFVPVVEISQSSEWKSTLPDNLRSTSSGQHLPKAGNGMLKSWQRSDCAGEAAEEMKGRGSDSLQGLEHPERSQKMGGDSTGKVWGKKTKNVQ